MATHASFERCGGKPVAIAVPPPTTVEPSADAPALPAIEGLGCGFESAPVMFVRIRVAPEGLHGWFASANDACGVHYLPPPAQLHARGIGCSHVGLSLQAVPLTECCIQLSTHADFEGALAILRVAPAGGCVRIVLAASDTASEVDHQLLGIADDDADIIILELQREAGYFIRAFSQTAMSRSMPAHPPPADPGGLACPLVLESPAVPVAPSKPVLRESLRPASASSATEALVLEWRTPRLRPTDLIIRAYEVHCAETPSLLSLPPCAAAQPDDADEPATERAAEAEGESWHLLHRIFVEPTAAEGSTVSAGLPAPKAGMAAQYRVRAATGLGVGGQSPGWLPSHARALTRPHADVRSHAHHAATSLLARRVAQGARACILLAAQSTP